MALKPLRCTRFSSRFMKCDNREQGLQYITEMVQPPYHLTILIKFDIYREGASYL